MIEDNGKEISNEIMNAEHNTRIEVVFNSLQIELPSFEEIAKIKSLGFEHIRILEQGLIGKDNREIIIQEKYSFEKHLDKLNDSEVFFYRLSAFYESLGDYDKAIELVQRSSELSDKPFIKEKYGELLLRRDVPEGVKILDELKTNDSCVNLALLYIQKRDIEKSLFYAKYAYENFDLHHKISTTYALLLLLNKDYCQSIAILKELVHEKDAPSYAYYLISLSYFIIKQYKKAFQNIRIAYALNHFNRDILVLYCALNEMDGNLNQSIIALEEYCKCNKPDEYIWQLLSKYYYLTNKFEKAIKPLQAVITLNDKLDWAWNNLALICLKQKNYEKANKYLSHALTLTNDDTVVFNYLQLLYELKEFSSIIDIFTALRRDRKDATYSDIFFQSFECYVESLKKLKKYSEYISELLYFYQFCKSSNQNENSILNYILCYYASEDKNRLQVYRFIELLDESISKNGITKKSYIKSINNLAFAYLEHNDIQGSEKYIKLLTAYLDNNPYYTATYGLYCLRNYNITKGEHYYNKAIGFSIDPEIKKLLAHKRDYEIGKVYIFEGLRTNAITFLRKATDGSDFVAKEALSLLDEIR